MPSNPTAQLIVSHSAFALAVLKYSFNPETLTLHISKSLCAGFLRRIAQRIFIVALSFRISPHDQVPTICLRIPFPPEPNPMCKDFVCKISFCRLTDFHLLPCARWLLRNPLMYTNWLCLHLVFCRLFAFAVGYLWLYRFQKNLLIFMDVNDKRFPHGIELYGKIKSFAISGISANPAISQIQTAGIQYQLKGKFFFAFMFYSFIRYPGFQAALRIISPLFRKKSRASTRVAYP